MNNVIELEFGTIRIYENILVSELNEGVLLDVESNRKILQIGTEIFKDEGFGYISHRLNSYAVDPMVYRESAEHPHLKAIAVVSNSEISRKSAQLEKKFYRDKNPFQIFSCLEEAKTWIGGIVTANYAKENSPS